MGSSRDMLPLPAMSQRSPAGEPVQWPRIAEDPRVLTDWWRGRPYSQPSPSPGRSRPDRPVSLRLAQAVVKGVVLGVAAAGTILGVVPALPWWQQGWHWQVALAAILLIAVLAGLSRGALVAVAVALVQSAPLLRGHGIFAGYLILAAIAVRVVWEGALIALLRS